MLNVAKKNHPLLRLTCDYSSIPNDIEFVYSIFDFASYQVTVGELEEFSRLVASKLRAGGLVVIDSWHYLGVKMDPPEVRERSFELVGNENLYKGRSKFSG